MVVFYFDFISPYSYLASQLIRRDYSEIEFSYRPVVFGSILARLEKKGPGEIPSQRRHGLRDILMLADHYNIPLEGPPKHPFNSVYALRSVYAVRDEAQRAQLTQRYFSKAWAEGGDLEDLDVLKTCLAELNIEQDPLEVATHPDQRKALKANTKAALNEGVWGVPTFVKDTHLFFGHDRLPLLAAYLDGQLENHEERLEAMLLRPQPQRIQ